MSTSKVANSTLSSKQFKQDINTIFNKLHSLLTGLEAKIIERDESLREEIKQEIHVGLLVRKEEKKRKDSNVTDTDPVSDNPVSMVVPVDPSQFIGTTIKHTSSYIADQTINLTIRAGLSNNPHVNHPTGDLSSVNCHNIRSTATVNSNGNNQGKGNVNCNSSIIKNCANHKSNNYHGNPSNNNFNVITNNNENSCSRQDCDSQDEPFKAIINHSNDDNKINQAPDLTSSSSPNPISLSPSPVKPTTNGPNVNGSKARGESNNSTDSDTNFNSNSTSSAGNQRVKENRCPMCAQRFTQLNSLKRHIRSHTGERPFPCGYCEKRFVDRERLKVHVRIHTGEKPFSCNLCSRRFSQKSTVKRHMSVHTGLKPFQCGSCSKRFGTRDNLRVHEKSHFPVDIKLKGINSSQVQTGAMDYR